MRSSRRQQYRKLARLQLGELYDELPRLGPLLARFSISLEHVTAAMNEAAGVIATLVEAWSPPASSMTVDATYIEVVPEERRLPA